MNVDIWDQDDCARCDEAVIWGPDSFKVFGQVCEVSEQFELGVVCRDR